MKYKLIVTDNEGNTCLRFESSDPKDLFNDYHKIVASPLYVQEHEEELNQTKF